MKIYKSFLSLLLPIGIGIVDARAEHAFDFIGF
jgi:hypothetical protein